MTRRRTFTSEHQRHLQRNHAESEDYGTHRHLYLHDTMRGLASEFMAAEQRAPSLFDYGCGKGRFIEEMRRLDVFGEISGYDPGFAAFAAAPDGRYDIVTCLDVLDAAEQRFRDDVIADVARLTAHRAVFDCLTKPLPKSGFAPHPPFHWMSLVAKSMAVVKTEIHFRGLDGFERAVIVARPQS
jgi:2-polyprenyl-3-methyl-5-hydroxy-6-metoxy-1,4-benzoquinol methylase